MHISKGRIALLAVLGVVALGIFVLIFFFSKGPSAPPAPENALNAAGTGGVQFTFGGEAAPGGLSGQPAGGQPSFNPAGGAVAPGVYTGNAFSGGANAFKGVTVTNGANVGVGGFSGNIQPAYNIPSLSDLISLALPFGQNASSAFSILNNIGSVIGSQDPYIQSLLTQYQNISAEQQKLYEMAQAAQQSAPTIPPDLIQGVSNGQVSLSISALQNLLNSQASATATFNSQITSMNSQALSLLNGQISQAQSSGVVSPQLQNAFNQVSQFNDTLAAFEQRSSDFNSQTTNLINQTFANSSGMLSPTDIKNLINQLNASTTALRAQIQSLQTQAANLTNSISLQ